MTAQEKEQKILACRRLGMTEEEIAEILEEDEEVDKMKDSEVNNDLTKEQREAIKASTKEHSGKYEKTEERKAKEEQLRQEKATAMGALMQGCNVVEIVNPNREFVFEFEGIKYRTVIKRVRKQ